MRVRRPEDHKPALVGEYAVVAIKSFANEQPVILQALLRTRGAEAGDGGIELDLQRRCAHLDGKEKAWNEKVAEREGFEPPVPQAVQQISSLPHSTTLPSLRGP